ncbi:MAG: glucose-6-phosphate isomerase [Caulobacterales bacterium]|nr:glucose-6-phosphate isomerase [Caulobacterales bacterium]
MSMTHAAWSALTARAAPARARTLAGLFEAEPDRARRLTIDAAGLIADLSKQPVSADDLGALLALARAADVEGRRAALFAGAHVNLTEDRPALHMALRGPLGAEVTAGGESVDAIVARAQAQTGAFAEAVRSGARAGSGGRPLRHILHLGIGGSDLGPRLVWEALKRRQDPAFTLHFAANVDPAEINDGLEGLDPESTLVVVVSKSFSTQETLANAQVARAWLAEHLGGEDKAGAHIVAVTANAERARAFGVAEDAVFDFRDWVGGRYSAWSPVSLSLEIAFEPGAIAALRAGAAAMDAHFRDAPLERNLPVLLALIGVWNRNVLGRPTRAVIPYGRRLRLLPQYLQQLEMESNGKGVALDGTPVSSATSAVVWGAEGTNAQHAFFQQLHQGPDVAPIDFVGILEDGEARPALHKALLSNLFAQAEALMAGKSREAARAELLAAGTPAEEADRLAGHKAFPGDRPSTTILLERLEPASLGALIALYEHKVFVESALWDINAFDQWGVELGKVLAKTILGELDGAPTGAHDASTAALIARARDAASD